MSRIPSPESILSTSYCTRILASAEVLADVDGLIVRPLGTFAPVGKSESVDLTEILGRAGEEQRLAALAESFAAGLAALDAECWSDAANCFRAVLEDFPEDGPASYFLHMAEAYSRNPPPPGAARPIRVNVK